MLHVLRFFLITAFLIAFSASCVRNAVERDAVFDHEYDAFNSKVVALVSRAAVNGKNFTYCGGTWISQHVIVTAWHCVARNTEKFCSSDLGATLRKCNDLYDDESRTVVFFRAYCDYVNGSTTNEPRRSIIYDSDPAHDIAILYTLDTAESIAKISARIARPGEKIILLGHPDSITYTVIRTAITDVYYVQRRSWRRYTRYIEVARSVKAGMSGGAAFNGSGELIGICSARSTSSDRSYYISSKHLLELLSTKTR